MNFTRQGPHRCLKLGAPGSPGRVANTHNSPAKQSIRAGSGASLNNVLYIYFFYPIVPHTFPLYLLLGMSWPPESNGLKAGRNGMAGGGSAQSLTGDWAIFVKLFDGSGRYLLTTGCLNYRVDRADEMFRCHASFPFFPLFNILLKYSPPFSFSPFLFRASFFSLSCFFFCLLRS